MGFVKFFTDKYASGSASVGVADPLPVTLGKSGAQLGSDISIFWGTGAAANTIGKLTDTNGVQYIDIMTPANPAQEYAVEVYNPSTQTDLTLKIMAKETAMGGAAREALITTLVIPKSQTVTGVTVASYLKLVHGMFMGSDVRMYFTNDTGTTLTTFNAFLRIREVSS